IHNFYYDGTVEAKVYQRLRQRIENFSSVVGGLQPILAKIPTLIEQATMSADPQEEEVLFAEFDHDLADPPLKVTLESMITTDVEADMASICQPRPASPITKQDLEQWLMSSPTLQRAGVKFAEIEQNSYSDKRGQQWLLSWQDKTYGVTFDPQQFEENPSLLLISAGDRLFEKLIQVCIGKQDFD
ncbi:MAG: hypothetical protein VKL42_07865, partial [Snowella sp.]|nr:hypothetical protein [Snowella sp.]